MFSSRDMITHITLAMDRLRSLLHSSEFFRRILLRSDRRGTRDALFSSTVNLFHEDTILLLRCGMGHDANALPAKMQISVRFAWLPAPTRQPFRRKKIGSVSHQSSMRACMFWRQQDNPNCNRCSSLLHYALMEAASLLHSTSLVSFSPLLSPSSPLATLPKLFLLHLFLLQACAVLSSINTDPSVCVCGHFSPAQHARVAFINLGDQESNVLRRRSVCPRGMHARSTKHRVQLNHIKYTIPHGSNAMDQRNGDG